MSDAEAQAADRFYPLSPKWMTTLFYVGLIGWAAGLLYFASDWSFQNRLFPLAFTALLIVLATVRLVILHFPDAMGRVIPDTPETGTGESIMETAGAETNERTGREREYYELNVIAWVLALPILLYVIGFLYTLPVYVFAFIMYYRRDVRTSIAAAALVTAVVYGLFVVILGVRLPGGILL